MFAKRRGHSQHFGRQHFDRDLLPDAESYFRDLFGPLRFNGSGWAMVSCPVHGPEKTPSLSIHRAGAGDVSHAMKRAATSSLSRCSAAAVTSSRLSRRLEHGGRERHAAR
jgi:hypothetical protein